MSTVQTTSKLSADELREEVRKEYAEVALDPQKGCHFHTGRAAADRIEYDPSLYTDLPEENIASFAGTGNPFMLGIINPSETVVDCGSGSGFDSLIASTLVGPGGRVIGVDMIPEMLKKTRAGAEKMGATHVEFREGLIENLTLPDEFADIVISNGVLNLTLDKTKTLHEWVRILKPGGRLFIGDILVARAIPPEALDDISLWTGWIAGGLPEADLLDAVGAAGFEEAEIVQKHDIFADVHNPSSALEFGTIGISLRARKPE